VAEFTLRIGQTIRTHPVLTSILVIALALRIQSLTWGIFPLEYVDRFHPDEFKYLDPALHFKTWYPTNRPFPMYGTSVQYLIGLVMYVPRLLFDLFDQFPTYLVAAHLFCRLVAVASGVGSVYLTWLVGKEATGPRTGLIAASFLSVSTLHALNSAIFTLDVPMSFLLMACVWACMRLEHLDSRKAWIGFGALIGILVGTKTTALVFFVVPATLYLSRRWPAVRGRRLVRLALLAGAVAVGAFLITNPQVFDNWQKNLEYARIEKEDWFDRLRPDSFAGIVAMAWQGLTGAMGTAVPAMALAGLFLVRGPGARYFLALGLLLVAYVAGLQHFLQTRYVIFIAPVVCLFAARTLDRIMEGRATQIRGAVIAGVVALSLHSAFVTQQGNLERLTDPRVDAARFIAEEFPAGTRVAFSMVSEEYEWTHNWWYPKLSNPEHERVTLFESPDLFVTVSSDLREIENAMSSGYLSESGAWDQAGNWMFYRYSAPTERLFAYWKDFLAGNLDFVEVGRFTNGTEVGEFPPPEVRVYAGKQNSETPPPPGSRR
jgi:hypothetical protein